MSPQSRVWLAGGLFAAVIAAALYFPALRQQVAQGRTTHRENCGAGAPRIVPVTPASSSEPKVKVKMFWGSGNDDGMLRPVTVELPLSDDPVLRAKEVLNTLLAGPSIPKRARCRPMPRFWHFIFCRTARPSRISPKRWALPFPSGIQSEQLAIDSIARTLEADVPQVQRIKILIHGQEVETLAGHIDLTQTFRVNTKVPGAPDRAGSLSRFGDHCSDRESRGKSQECGKEVGGDHRRVKRIPEARKRGVDDED